jgi:asparagine synthase (glutamine-hydrolysing)
MCGIAGIVVGTHPAPTAADIDRVSEAIRHRGPDDVGYLGWSPGGAVIPSRHPAEVEGCRTTLIHRRLSILDLSPSGWQPMSTPDGRYHIVFNGEIYNYVELRTALAAHGYQCRSQSDTEVLLAALATWGTEALARLEGMFAFALLDVVGGTLTLARDFFGIKPLFCHWDKDRFAFASETKALLQLPGVSREANVGRTIEYLTSAMRDDGAETMLRAIRQLPAAHLMTVRIAERLVVEQPRRYWSLATNERLDISRREASVMVRDAFLGSVARHLRSDVPVGAALSGGIDSSSIVAAMRRVTPPIQLHAFSYIADDPSISEARWVGIAAEAADAVVHEVHLTPHDLATDIDRLIDVQDEPFGSTSMYAQYRIFGAAANAGIRVMLTGQGADELLGGYAPFVAVRFARLVRAGRWVRAASLLASTSGQADVVPRAMIRYALGASTPRWIKGRFRNRIHAAALATWWNRKWLAARGLLDAPAARDPGPDVRAHLQRSVSTSLLSLLRYDDRNSMAHSVESRVPFLTPAMAQLAFSLPDDFLVDQNGRRKAVFRDAMRGIVPDPILDRREKLGFPTPERSWLQALQPWVDSVLGSETAARIPLFRAEVLRDVRSALATGRPLPRGFPLWLCLNLIRWAEVRGVTFD